MKINIKYVIPLVASMVFAAGENVPDANLSLSGSENIAEDTRGFRLPPGAELIGRVVEYPTGTFRLAPGSVIAQEIEVNGKRLWVKMERRLPSDPFDRFQRVEERMRGKAQPTIAIAKYVLGALLEYNRELDEIFDSLGDCDPETNPDKADPDHEIVTESQKPTKTGEMKFQELAAEFNEVFRSICLYYKAGHELDKNENNFAQVWNSLSIGPTSSNPLHLSEEAFREFSADSESSSAREFRYFQKYLFEKGLKRFNSYENVCNLGERIPSNFWSACMDYSEENWPDLQKMLPGLIRIAVDPKRYAIASSVGIQGGYDYAVYVTTNKYFTFNASTNASTKIDSKNADHKNFWSIRQYFSDFSSVLGYVTLGHYTQGKQEGSEQETHFLTQRGINSSLPNLMREKPVKIGLMLTQFVGAAGHALSPDAEELYINGALRPMAHLIRSGLDKGQYKEELGNSFWLNVDYLRALWREQHPPMEQVSASSGTAVSEGGVEIRAKETEGPVIHSESGKSQAPTDADLSGTLSRPVTVPGTPLLGITDSRATASPLQEVPDSEAIPKFP